jgi:hypothetical protein
MIRTLSIAAALATALVTFPALAETTASTPAATTDSKPAARGAIFNEKQARTHLLHLGYSNVSGLTKDENGVWHGSATKDGKTLTVAVDLKSAPGK